MSIDFTQFFNVWLKSSTYHPPLPPFPIEIPMVKRGLFELNSLPQTQIIVRNIFALPAGLFIMSDQEPSSSFTYSFSGSIFRACS